MEYYSMKKDIIIKSRLFEVDPAQLRRMVADTDRRFGDFTSTIKHIYIYGDIVYQIFRAALYKCEIYDRGWDYRTRDNNLYIGQLQGTWKKVDSISHLREIVGYKEKKVALVI